jgi:prepilin-type N-terminal cleavage/methylation domain-containing protein
MEKRVERGRALTSKGNPGFSLAELMAVILILGFVFLLTFPNFRGLLEPRDAKRAVLQLVGSMRYAQSQAAATKQRFRLNLDLKENAYWVSREGERDSFLRDASPLGKPAYLPAGVTFLDVSHPERGKMRKGTAYVEFSPTGWADECEIHLRRGEEEIFTLFVHPLGGKTEVTAGYVERKTS